MQTILIKISDFMEGVFGKNWRTSSSGLIALFSLITVFTIYFEPGLVSFLPDGAEKIVLGICKLTTVVFGFFFVIFAKDSKVTGGTVPQTEEAKDRMEEKKIE